MRYIAILKFKGDPLLARNSFLFFFVQMVIVSLVENLGTEDNQHLFLIGRLESRKPQRRVAFSGTET